MTDVLVRRGEDTDTGRSPCDNRGRDGSDVTASQGAPTLVTKSNEEARKNSLLQVP